MLFSIQTSDGNDLNPADPYVKMQLEANQELGIDINGNVTENASKYYKKMFGDHFEFEKTRYVTLRRACNELPINPDNMDLFTDMMMAPYVQFLNWDNVYLVPQYRSDPETLNPKRYYLAKSLVLSDMLYWEWKVDDIQLRKLESYNGMLLFITPKDFVLNKGISGKRCAEVLAKVTKIGCDPDELQKQFNFPSELHEGDVFSNIPNFEKITSNFPFPTDPDQWRKQLVGLISKDAICLILVHGKFPKQIVVFNNPTILDIDARWLSGRILYKGTKTPVLPRGVTKMPESWKLALENNAKWEKWGLEMAEKERVEEAKWRVWHDRSGKPMFNGEKMRFVEWDKRPIKFVRVNEVNLGYTASSYRDGTVSLEWRRDGSRTSCEFPLGQFCEADKKLIMATPPLKYERYKGNMVSLPRDEDKPKEPEPEVDDIE
ncbi:MAG: hypothetical protein LBJ00_11820 [Planctomycetaceae bacterium]|nr:hypothetical protein [Planctomycetaceae bacterium]